MPDNEDKHEGGEALGLTAIIGPDNNEKPNGDTLTSTKSAESGKMNNERAKENNHDTNEVCGVSLFTPSLFPSYLPFFLSRFT